MLIAKWDGYKMEQQFWENKPIKEVEMNSSLEFLHGGKALMDGDIETEYSVKGKELRVGIQKYKIEKLTDDELVLLAIRDDMPLLRMYFRKVLK